MRLSDHLLELGLAGILVFAVTSAPTAAASAPLHGTVAVIAHRGSSYDAPEHTFAAYDQAVADDADFLECDLQLTRDGVLVCIHDTSVDRTSNGSGEVSEFSLAELRALDFGSWFNEAYPERARPRFAHQRVVAFEEQLACYRELNSNLRFHVETKQAVGSTNPDAVLTHGRMEAELVRVLERHGLLNPDAATAPVLVQSFDPSSLALVNDLTGDGVPTALLTLGPGPQVLPPQVDIAAPNHLALLADPAYIALQHAQGKEVHTYTVDSPGDMRTLISAGIDGVFTNRPALMRELLAAEFPEFAVPAAERANPSASGFSRGCPGHAGSVAPA